MQRRLSRPEKGKYFSDGARLMWLAIEARGWSQTELAAKLGTSSGQVSQWLYGGRRASLKWAVQMRDVLDIPLGAWNQAAPEGFEFPAPRERESGPSVAHADPTAKSSNTAA